MRKKTFTLLTLFSLISVAMMSQTAQRNCGTMQHLSYLKTQDAGLEDRMNLIEQQTALWEQNHAAMKTSATVVNIPVVVHVLYNTSSQNITDAQIKSQIDVLNEDYRKLNADRTTVPSAFAGLAADIEINFCLASKNPSGATTTGIVRKSTTKTSFSDDDGAKYSSTGGDDAWNSSQYLNLWVCNLGGGLLGYAQFPGGPAATDGVVILYSSFGRTGTVSAPYDKGRTATHEVGHWLNLRHIWGDASCGSDLVNDTPTQQTSNYGCPTYPHKTCSNTTSGDMFMNYMDYTDDGCMNMFSAGQKTRMQALFASGGSRAAILTSQGCGAVTTTTTATTTPTSGTSNTLTVGNGTGTSVTPYGTYYMDEKVQYIITKSELMAAGYSSVNSIIKSLAFNVASASTQVMNGFTIKLKHTTNTSFSSTSFLTNTGMTTVYSANTIASVGWKTHSFTTPFTYNGTDNLLVEICFDNSAYSTDSKAYYTATSTYNTLYLRSDVPAGGTCANTTGIRSLNRPNMRLAFSSSSSLVILPNNDLTSQDNSTLRTIPKDNLIDFQLAPNPTSSMINVTYNVETENSEINIKLYNMMGKLVAEFEPHNQTEGKSSYEINLNTATNIEELQGGVYLCALSINDEIQTKKFMLIK
jgi:hypothetical protein